MPVQCLDHVPGRCLGRPSSRVHAVVPSSSSKYPAFPSRPVSPAPLSPFRGAPQRGSPEVPNQRDRFAVWLMFGDAPQTGLGWLIDSLLAPLRRKPWVAPQSIGLPRTPAIFQKARKCRERPVTLWLASALPCQPGAYVTPKSSPSHVFVFFSRIGIHWQLLAVVGTPL